MNKICNKCHIEKPINEFPKNSQNKDKLFGYCKICKRIRDRLYAKTHPEIMKKHRTRWEKIFLDSWKVIIPNQIKCELCGKDIFFVSKDKSTSIHFDHRHGRNVIKLPGHWLRKHPLNKKNLAIWESCDFGMLCGTCNRTLPTDNRDEWFKNANRYINRTSKMLHASESTRGIIAT
jgi:hypothetical protein